MTVFVNGHSHHHHHRRQKKNGNNNEEVPDRPGFFANGWNNETRPPPIWAMEQFPSQGKFIDSGARCAYRDRSEDDERTFEDMFKIWKDVIAKGKNKGWFDGRRLKTVTVPTYFHVMQDGKKGAVSDLQIDQQMQVLNDAFAGSGFRFQLKYQNGDKASRTSNKKWYQGKEERKYKDHLRQGGKNALNVYLNQAKGYLGYAYYPSDTMAGSILDGCVILYGGECIDTCDILPAGCVCFSLNAYRSHHTFRVTFALYTDLDTDLIIHFVSNCIIPQLCQMATQILTTSEILWSMK